MGMGDLLFLLLVSLSPSLIAAQSTSISSSRPLDTLLQDYAFRAFVNPRTGIPYNAPLPSNLTAIRISALRLRSGSLRTRGFHSYNEFHIPLGVVVNPYVQRLVLVYQNLANWSSFYYHLPGYTHLTPVLGLLAYDASNLSAKGLPELDIKADSDQPILINFAQLNPVPHGSTAQCVWFDLDGLTQFTNVTSPGNVCSTLEQGHFSIVVESTAPAPSPLPVSPPSAGEGPPSNPNTGGGGGGGGGEDHNSKVWIIVGSVVGGLLFLGLLAFLLAWVWRYKRRNKMHKMEKAAEVGESLNMTSVGNTRAPVAMVTRTQPTIENEYVMWNGAGGRVHMSCGSNPHIEFYS